jgi:hypothetical protein
MKKFFEIFLANISKLCMVLAMSTTHNPVSLSGSSADRRKSFRRLARLGGVRYKVKGRKLATGVKLPVAS